MQITYQTLELKKRYPLRISRGEITGSTNLMLSLQQEGVTGIGETAPGDAAGADTAGLCQAQLENFIENYDLAHSSPHQAWQAAREAQVEPCAYAALDIAWWDNLARRCRQPLFRVLGLSPIAVPTSLTIGILPPQLVLERVPEILSRTGARFLKVKLGSTEGIDADQSMFSSVLAACKGFDVGIRVDANGGWSLGDARKMMRWLADRDVEYIEQPLVHGSEDQFADLFRGRALPIYADESCNFASDVPRLAASVDGVNLKLMKCGGITEALRIVATARAHGLKTMIGCMGESSISISAAAAIGSLFDYIDLDSHLNLFPAPASGAELRDGIILPSNDHGHGATLKC